MKAHPNQVKISLNKLAAQKQSKALSRRKEYDKLYPQTPAFNEAITRFTWKQYLWSANQLLSTKEHCLPEINSVMNLLLFKIAI